MFFFYYTIVILFIKLLNFAWRSDSFFVPMCFIFLFVTCQKRVYDESWLDSLHAQGREIFYRTIQEKITSHPEKERLTETEIQKIMEAETRYERLYEHLMNIFYQKDEPTFRSLLESRGKKPRSRFNQMYLELARFSGENFVECFFATDAASEYIRNNMPAYEGLDAVDLVIRSIGYHAKLDLPKRRSVQHH